MVHSLLAGVSRKKFHDENRSEVRKMQTQILDKIHEFQQLECEFRQEDHQAVQKSTCNYRSEDHARLSDTLMLAKTNEIFLKEVANDIDGIVKAMERMVDKFESIAKESRQETNLLHEILTKRLGKK